MTLPRVGLLIPALAICAAAAPLSPLGARGYAVLPAPQRVTLTGGDFRFGAGWSIERKGVAAEDAAAISLSEGLSSRFHIVPSRTAHDASVTLVLAPGSVSIGDALDSDKQALLS